MDDDFTWVHVAKAATICVVITLCIIAACAACPTVCELTLDWYRDLKAPANYAPMHNLISL